MSEREPLHAQYSNILSVTAKLCLQIANHHAFQSIHTCIITHLICSCICKNCNVIRICILNSYVNLNQNQSCQLQISSANNKCLLSCQFQSSTALSTFLSNSSSCSYVDQIQFLFKCNSFLLTAKWLVRTQEQLVPANSLLLSVK